MAQVQPALETLKALINDAEVRPNVVPVYATIPADMVTPSAAYLKLSQGAQYSFLLESVSGGENLGRYSFIGANPYRVSKSGPGFGKEEDPLIDLERDLKQYRTIAVPGIPPFPGGAIGYISYDCVKYFEPRTKRELKDPLNIPESLLMFHDTLVCFDHIYSLIKVVAHLHIPPDSDIDAEYIKAGQTIQKLSGILLAPQVPSPHQGPIDLKKEYTSNIGQEGYERHVTRLKKHIKKGDIIQAVPSQRVSRPTDLHPFNIYRQLRQVNPSPYMFYIDCDDFQIIGASPELLVKEDNGRVITHPIAGTVRRDRKSVV